MGQGLTTTTLQITKAAIHSLQLPILKALAEISRVEGNCRQKEKMIELEAMHRRNPETMGVWHRTKLPSAMLPKPVTSQRRSLLCFPHKAVLPSAAVACHFLGKHVTRVTCWVAIYHAPRKNTNTNKSNSNKKKSFSGFLFRHKDHEIDEEYHFSRRQIIASYTRRQGETFNRIVQT